MTITAIKQFEKTLDISTGEICKALPPSINLERFKRIVLTEIKSNPKLLDCALKNPKSLFGAIIKTAQFGLEPGNGLGHAYFVPFGTEVQFMIGYRGMIDLARRSGEIESISAHCVYENDHFEFRYGMRERLDHKPCIENRGKIIAVYAIAKLKSGGFQFEVMGIDEIEKIKSCSKSARYSGSIWEKHYGEMCRKTAVRRLFKYLPVAAEQLSLIAADSRSGIEGETQHNEEVFEGEFSVQESSKSDDVASLISVE